MHGYRRRKQTLKKSQCQVWPNLTAAMSFPTNYPRSSLCSSLHSRCSRTFCAALRARRPRTRAQHSTPTIVLTFPTTIFKHHPTLDVLECSVPCLGQVRRVLYHDPAQDHDQPELMSPPGQSHSQRNTECWVMLTSGCSPPLAEDWCLCEME